jgi:adenosylcobinamide-GDP ribazoletransferase
MKGLFAKKIAQWRGRLTKSFLGAVIFYTTIALPKNWQVALQRIARWAPCIGLLIGGLLGLLDTGLQLLGLPVLTRSVVVVAVWIALTGGLHLDGAMDAADGLAVGDRTRRLEVMKDSSTGAFGAMTAVIIVLFKVAALCDLSSYRWLALMAAAGWGRWGQVAAIAFYPYLKPTGKGAFHKEKLRLPQDLLLGSVVLLGLSGSIYWLAPQHWWLGLAMTIAGIAIALLSGFWFYFQLGGHTGDTYGAVVEWTEAFLLCFLTGLFARYF